MLECQILEAGGASVVKRTEGLVVRAGVADGGEGRQGTEGCINDDERVWRERERQRSFIDNQEVTEGR
jgi:hypothetical protein